MNTDFTTGLIQAFKDTKKDTFTLSDVEGVLKEYKTQRNEARAKVFMFGKYKGKQIMDVAALDPGYLKWLKQQSWYEKWAIIHPTVDKGLLIHGWASLDLLEPIPHGYCKLYFFLPIVDILGLRYMWGRNRHLWSISRSIHYLPLRRRLRARMPLFRRLCSRVAMAGTCCICSLGGILGLLHTFPLASTEYIPSSISRLYLSLFSFLCLSSRHE